MKRFIDILLSFIGLIIVSPLLLLVMFLVWWNDKYSPLYISTRIGQNNIPFQMIKMRSMVINADLHGSSSTANEDQRITPIGHFIRRYKIDEFMQLYNVLVGNMSLVGPRPQVRLGVEQYTSEEKKLLNLKPGITDFASIVFSDEGTILAGSSDPDKVYDQLIRPGKSRLGLFYLKHKSIYIDLCLIFLTLVALFSRKTALFGVKTLLKVLKADNDLIILSSRQGKLVPMLPPGA
jgi:lipopolysaccharide/colanic/teichoic acid biosynthesis glycosyltransferase